MKNAFLQGDLVETINMVQLPRFIDPAHPTHVCYLKEAIYELKKCLILSFNASVSITVYFTQCCANHSLFSYRLGSTNILLLLYLDNIILTGNQPSQLSFVRTHGKECKHSDLVPMFYFFGS